MAVTARVLATTIVAHLDGLSTIDAFLSEGPTPPRGRVVVVHPDPGRHRGPLGDPDRDLRMEFQTTAIGATPEQALWVHDQVAAELWRTSLTVDGTAATLPIWAVDGSEQPVRRDDDLAEPLFYLTCAWIAHAQPN